MSPKRDPSDAVAWIETVSPEAADSELSACYAEVVDPESGQLDNIMRVHGLHPAGLRAHQAIYLAAMSGTKGLRKVDREMIALAVSQVNGCHY